jgi:hypothetical protein
MDIALIVLIVSFAVALGGVAVWLYQLFSRKAVCDPSPAKGSESMGVMWAFTIGMLPWKKDSARLHWFAYLRGIGFHTGILAGIVVLVLSVFSLHGPAALDIVLCVLAGLGAVCGLAAIVGRAVDPMLRGISRIDDYVAPILVTVFLALAALRAVDVAGNVPFFVATSVLCLYLPWSKVRHCVHFFFSRVKLGAWMGHRGLLETPHLHPKKVIK